MVSPLNGPEAEFRVKVAVSLMRSVTFVVALLSSSKLPRPLMVKAAAEPRRAVSPLSWNKPPLTVTEPVNRLVLVCPL